MTSPSITETTATKGGAVVAIGLQQLASAMAVSEFSTAVGIWELAQPSGATIYLNTAMCRLLEVENQQDLGARPYLAFFSPESLPTVRAHQLRLAEGSTSVYEADLIGARGGKRNVVVSTVPLVGSDGRIISSTGTFTDLTAQRRAEEALRSSEKRYGELLERSSEFIFRIDLHGNFLAMNSAVERITGYSRRELANIRDVLAPEYRDHAIGIGDATIELAILNRNGVRAYLEVRTTLTYKDGEPAEIFGVGRDITASKQAEQLTTARGAVLEIAAQNRLLEQTLARLTELLEADFPGVASSLATDIAVDTSLSIGHRALTAELVHLSQHDKLTGLPNRLAFEDRLAGAISAARRRNAALALLYIDVDRFKLVNDTLGHARGDSLLVDLAARLKHVMRDGDTLARVGSDEFILLLAELDAPEQPAQVSADLLEAFQKPFGAGTEELFVTVSIGISVFPRDGDDALTLQRNADAAMQRAKGLGKNNCQFFAPQMTAPSARQLEIRNQLHRALERNELTLSYQPQMDLRTGKLIGLEALLRWTNPLLGSVSPAEFIPVAEDSGLIVPIGNWVLRRACFENRLWQKLGYEPIKVAVNVSAIQFAQANFVDSVADSLRCCSLAARYLELELTESVVMNDHVECFQQLEQLSALGVNCSIDDFGTGYSSLQYLQKLPIQSLKIDLSFVRDIREGQKIPPLIEAITGLAHGMKLSVIAEGVEEMHQLLALRKVGCDHAQGFLLGHPVAAEQVRGLLSVISAVLPIAV